MAKSAEDFPLVSKLRKRVKFFDRDSLTPKGQDLAEAVELFQRSRAHIVVHYPFFGHLLLCVTGHCVGPHVCPTAAVNYRNIYFQGLGKETLESILEKMVESSDDNDPLFDVIREAIPFQSLNIHSRAALLVHEILHLVFEHLTVPKDFNHDIANIAQDLVINRIIHDTPDLDISLLPAGVVRVGERGGKEGLLVGHKQTKFYPIPGIRELDWMPIYYALMEQISKEAGGDKSRLQRIIDGLVSLNPIHGDCDYEGEGQEGKASEADKQRFRAKVMDAWESSKGIGKLPDELERHIRGLQEGKVPWTYYLRNVLRDEIARDDFTIYPPNLRRLHIAYLPKVESTAVGDVYLVLDTSGSMGDEEIRKSLSELKSLRETVPFRLHFISCDCSTNKQEIHTWEPDQEPDWYNMPLVGGGGTDFRPAFDAIEEKVKETKRKPAVVVYATDTWGVFPEEQPPYPVIWVSPHKSGESSVPWGTLICTGD